jgi:hypothetical protein
MAERKETFWKQKPPIDFATPHRDQACALRAATGVLVRLLDRLS